MKKLKRKKVKKRASKKKSKRADMQEVKEYVSGLRTLHDYQGALLRRLDMILTARNPGGGTG